MSLIIVPRKSNPEDASRRSSLLYAKKGFHEDQRPSISVNPSNSNASIFIYKSVTTLGDGYTSLNKAGEKRKA